MHAIQTLDVRMREREQFVIQITEQLQADSRVVAVALVSSYARGEIDGLSDLDILVIVEDKAVADFVPPRKAEVDRFGAVVWCHEVPGNSPPGGSYLGVGFCGAGYPQCTDWYWQPLSLAAFPTPSVAIVEKTRIRRVAHKNMVELVTAGRPDYPPPPASPEFRPLDPVAGHWSFQLAMFWRMSGVAASRLARGHTEKARSISADLEKILGGLAETTVPGQGFDFERLRELCLFAESLVPSARSLGALVPEDRNWVMQTIDFMEALTQEGWRSPK